MILGTGPCCSRVKKYKKIANCSKIDESSLVDDEKHGKGHGMSFVRVYNGEKKNSVRKKGFFGWVVHRKGGSGGINSPP